MREPLHDLRALRREIRSLRDRFARLSGTVLRISSGLDPDTALQEVVDGACALTGAGKGVITTIDERGRRVDLLTSGLSAGEVRALAAWPEGPRLFEHLRDIEQPFQLAELPGCFESSGLPPGPWPTRMMQGAPMRRRAGRSATSSSATRRTARRAHPRTRRSWCCSPRRRPPRLRLRPRARTPRAGGRGPTSRTWWRPRRWAWWCSRPAAEGWPRRGDPHPGSAARAAA